MDKIEIINNLIRKEQVDTNKISDGYHTFGELYEHRVTIFITLCRIIQDRTLKHVWRYQTDADWFLLGIDKAAGHQISYHLPMSKWKDTEFAHTVTEKDKPEFDGHTSKDVLDRLNKLK